MSRITKRHMESMGRIIYGFQALESDVAAFVGMLVGDFGAGERLTAPLSFSALVDTLVNLWEYRLGEQDSQIRALAERMRKVNSQRNKWVHSHWTDDTFWREIRGRKRDVSGRATRSKAKTRGPWDVEHEDVSPTDMDAFSAQIEEVTSAFLRLLRQPGVSRVIPREVFERVGAAHEA